MNKDTYRADNEDQRSQDDVQDTRMVFTINLDYLFSWRAALKTLEIIVLITAMSCMVQYDTFWTRYPATLIVYYMVVCLSWIMQLIFFVMAVCSLEHRLPLYHWDLCGVFTSVVEVVFLVVVAGLMANDALLHRKLEWQDISDDIRHHYYSLIAAVALTLIASLVFVIDAILHAVLFFKGRRRNVE